MNGFMNIDNLVAVKDTNNTNVIGKLLYFTIGKALIKEERFKEIIKECGINANDIPSKHTNTHAFKSATKRLERKRKVIDDKGNIDIYNIKILDNAKGSNRNQIWREIKQEVVKEKKNQMVYLGNMIYDKDSDVVSYSLNPATIQNLDFDLKAECSKILDLYEYAKDCYNEDRIVKAVENYVKNALDASPISIHGKLFFVPMFRNDELTKLEQLLMMIEQENEADGSINFASIPVMEEEKYIKEYTKEFYAMAQNEIDSYQKNLQRMITTGTATTKTLDRWIDKIQQFIYKKKQYEDLFKKNLDELDEDMAIINRQIRELTIKAELKESEKIQ